MAYRVNRHIVSRCHSLKIMRYVAYVNLTSDSEISLALIAWLSAARESRVLLFASSVLSHLAFYLFFYLFIFTGRTAHRPRDNVYPPIFLRGPISTNFRADACISCMELSSDRNFRVRRKLDAENLACRWREGMTLRSSAFGYGEQSLNLDDIKTSGVRKARSVELNRLTWLSDAWSKAWSGHLNIINKFTFLSAPYDPIIINIIFWYKYLRK